MSLPDNVEKVICEQLKVIRDCESDNFMGMKRLLNDFYNLVTAEIDNAIDDTRNLRMVQMIIENWSRGEATEGQTEILREAGDKLLYQEKKS